MQTLEIYAGKKALKTIQSEGFHPQLFDAFLGASGGPKWFILAGLDRVIFPEFFDNQSQSIDLIGSSAGAFRTACLTQNDPRAAINRLAKKYSTTVYSDRPTAREITQKGYELLNYVMGDSGIEESISNKTRIAHFSVAQCHGLVSSERKYLQMVGLLKSALQNYRARSKLSHSFTRAMFSSIPKETLFIDPDKFPTNYYQLTKENYVAALMASGSIPLVLEGVENIPGAVPGMYRDGGIIDYHFDLAINTDKLVLYPHFYSTPTPGWFDKNLKKRQCAEASYDNVVLISPSKEFVDTLPFKKIPDRKDFEDMDAQQRIKYWSHVIDESDRMGEEFLNIVDNQKIVELVQPITLNRK